VIVDAETLTPQPSGVHVAAVSFGISLVRTAT
jgi:hypothetical protein